MTTPFLTTLMTEGEYGYLHIWETCANIIVLTPLQISYAYDYASTEPRMVRFVIIKIMTTTKLSYFFLDS